MPSIAGTFPIQEKEKAMSFFKKAKMPSLSYDPATQEPAVRKSICTGEMTAGYIDKATGKFHEWMRVDDLEAFRKAVGTDDVKIIY